MKKSPDPSLVPTGLEVGLLLYFGPKPEFVRQFNASATHSSN
jgi:hypothetical protein